MIKKPGVEVTQELVSPSIIAQTPVLNAVIAGVSKKVHSLIPAVDIDDIEKKYNGAAYTGYYPNLEFQNVTALNEVPDSASVSLYLPGAKKYVDNSLIVFSAGSETVKPSFALPAALLTNGVTSSITGGPFVVTYDVASKTLTNDDSAFCTATAVGDVIELHSYKPDIYAHYYHATTLPTGGDAAKGDLGIEGSGPYTLKKYNGSTWDTTAEYSGKVVLRANASGSTSIDTSIVTNYMLVTVSAAAVHTAATIPSSVSFRTVVKSKPTSTTFVIDPYVNYTLPTVDLTDMVTAAAQGLLSKGGTIDSNMLHKVKSFHGTLYTPSYETGAVTQVLVDYVADLAPSIYLDGSSANIYSVDSQDTATSLIGAADPRNPLGLSYYIATVAGASDVMVAPVIKNVGTNVYTVDQDPSDFGAVIDEIELEPSIYPVVFLSQKDAAITSLITHIDDVSLPENKNERIAFISRSYAGLNSNKNTRTSDAVTIATVNEATANRRIFSVYPDKIFMTFTLPWSVLNNMVTTQGLTALATGDLYSDAGLKIVTSYDTLTTAKLALLSPNINPLGASNLFKLTVLLEVPAYYACVSEAVECVLDSPSKPHTNTPVEGFTYLRKVSDWFTEKQLDIIAGGGTFILYQEASRSAVLVRHQLSTDVTSVESAELNVTKQVDYASKYYRSIIVPYIGKFVISNKLKDILKFAINSASNKLMRNGDVEDAKLVSMVVNANSADTLDIVITIKPFFALNYVNITIQY